MDRKNHHNSGKPHFRPFNADREHKAIQGLRNCQLPQGPRYVVKEVNGIWTIFDRFTFRNVEPDLGSEIEATNLLNL